MSEEILKIEINVENNFKETFNEALQGIKSLTAAVKDFGFVSDGIGKVAQAFASVSAAGMENELQKMNMTTLFQGNAEAAEDMFERISQYAKATPYDKQGLIEAQKTMMSFGIEGEKSFKVLKQIGDIAMGDKGKMQSLSLAFAQMSSAGKLNGQDLMQMINAGFNPLNEISKATGKSIGELKDEMSKGAISVEMVEQAFASATGEGGLFYQSIDKASGTAAAKLASIRASIDDVKISLFEATGGATMYLQAAGEIAADLGPLVSALEITYKAVQFTGKAFSAAKKFAAGFAAKAKAAVEKLRKDLLKLHGAIIEAGGLFKFMEKMGVSACRKISMALYSIPIVGWIAAGIAVVSVVLQQLWDKCEGFRKVVFGVWEVIRTGALAAWEIIRPVAQFIFEHIMEKINFYLELPGKIVEGLKTAFAWIVEKLSAIHNWLKNSVFAPIVEWFGNLWENTIKPITDKIKEKLKVLFNPIIKLWNKVTGKVVQAYKEGAEKGSESFKKDKKKKKAGDNPLGDVLASLNGGGANSGGANTLGSSTSAGSNSIATGGSRSTTVNITIGDMIRECVFNGSTGDNIESIRNNFAEALNWALGMAMVSV